MSEENYQCGYGNIKFELFLRCLNEDVRQEVIVCLGIIEDFGFVV